MRKWLSEKLRTVYYDPHNKAQSQEAYINYMLIRTQQIFRYSGLPDTIPSRVLELYLQCNGHCFFTERDGGYYVYTGGLGGEPDVYYQPTLYTVANPAQNFSRSFVIGDDGILLRNDQLMIGLLPLYSRYAYHMTENDLSLWVADINTRILGLISAGDDRTLASARQYLADIKNGELGTIAENAFLEGIKVQPYAGTTRGMMKDLIEYQQYLRATWCNEIGLDANYNMKRESMSTSETDMNSDMLLPLVDSMLACRREALEAINEKYGLEITVDFSSAWEDTHRQRDLIEESLEAEAEGADPEGDDLKDSDVERGEVKPSETDSL